MSSSSAEKTEANRRNAQKSSGPKSAEGKSRSRFNALKHGMRATVAVLPDEDPAAFSARVDDWTADLKPRNKVEQYLVDQAAAASWRLDRIDLAHVARLTININNAVADAARGLNPPEGNSENVPLLGSRLFWDTRGPLALYPHSPPDGHSKKAFLSWSGDVNDPNNPESLLLSLESTAKGCGWLLDQWAELRSILEQGKAWQSPDKLKAIRLLGRQPLDAFDDPKVGVVFLACHQLDPNGGELFHEVWKELEPSDRKIARQRVAGRPLDSLQPQTEVEARQALLSIIEKAVGRLELIAATHRERAEANARLLPARLAFDDSMQGERLRRYETSCSRTLLRTLDAFDKRQRAAADNDDEIDPVVPTIIDECVPVSAIEVEPDVAINAELPNEPTAPTSPHHHPELPNEPTAVVSQHDNAELPNEPTAVVNPHTNPEMPNEPTAATTPQYNPEMPNEPTAATTPQHNPEMPNEPTAPTSPHHINAELPNEPTARVNPQYNPELPNLITAFISRHLKSKLPNEPTALISLQHGGVRKQIERGTHRGDWDARPKTGPNRRARRARKARSQKADGDLTWFHPPGNLLAGKPP